MYLMPASPLARIFIPAWHDRLIEDPKLIESDEPFDITVPTSNGAFNFRYKVPRAMFQPKADKAFETDYVWLARWLIGGEDGTQYKETAMYGIVEFKGANDAMAEMNSLMHLPETDEHYKKKMAALQKKSHDQMRQSFADAKDRADRRVHSAIVSIVDNLYRERNWCKSHNIPNEDVTDVEYLCLQMYGATFKNRRQKDLRKQQVVNDYLGEQKTQREAF